MPSITEQLFYGTIVPSEQTAPHGKEFRQTMIQLQQEKSYFISSLSPEQLEHLEHFEALWGDASVSESCASFSEGFHLGLSIMIEHFQRE